MLRTYIINLKKDKDRFYRIKKNLALHNFKHVYRVDAIYGTNDTDWKKFENKITLSNMIFGIPSALGGGMSHYKALERSYKYFLKKKLDNSDFTLILEDDCLSLYNYSELLDIIKRIPDDLDVLGLNFTYPPLIDIQKKSRKEFIKKDLFMFGLQACAYLVRTSSIPKIIDCKLYSFIDFQHFNINLDLSKFNLKNIFSLNQINKIQKIEPNLIIYYLNKNFFKTDETTSYNRNLITDNFLIYIAKWFLKIIDCEDYYYLLSFYAFKLPIINRQVTVLEVFIFFLFIIVFLKSYIDKILIKSDNMFHIIGILFLELVVFFIIIYIFIRISSIIPTNSDF